MRSRVLLWSTALALAASAANAGPPVRVTPLPLDGAFQFDPPARTTLLCATAYSNMVNFAYYYPAGSGKEVIDDLHLTGSGDLCGFSFTYTSANSATTDATVTFYANDGPGGSPGSVVAGPFYYYGLPRSNHPFSAQVPEGVSVIGPIIWLGVSFTEPTTGLLLANPPSIGASDDLFYQRPEESFMSFGGNPVANFTLTVQIDSPSPIRVSSWGAIKTIYRN